MNRKRSAWQKPTAWSRETKDGKLYIERTSSGWVSYVRGKKVGVSTDELKAKRVAEGYG